jgi:hypothetical protein
LAGRSKQRVAEQQLPSKVARGEQWIVAVQDGVVAQGDNITLGAAADAGQYWGCDGV